MASSFWGGFVEYRVGLSDGPRTDTAPAMPSFAMAAANNALHLCDQSAAVWVNEAAVTSTSGHTLATTATKLIHYWGPFDLRFHSGEDPFKLRVRLAGYDTASNDQTIRLVLATSEFAELDRDEAGSNTTDFTVTGGTTQLAWYSGATNTIVPVTSLGRYEVETEALSVDPKPGYSDQALMQIRQRKFFLYAYNMSTQPTTSCHVLVSAAEYTG